MIETFQIALIRKPMSQSITENVLECGIGSLNIGSCRVGNEVVHLVGPANGGRKYVRRYSHGENLPNVVLGYNRGRFPANIVFCHSQECTQDGTKQVKGHRGYPKGPGGICSKEYQQSHQDAIGFTQTSSVVDNEPWEGYADENGKETIVNWDCSLECSVRALNKQNPFTSQTGNRKDKHRTQDELGVTCFSKGKNSPEYLDSGGASRFFKCFGVSE